MKQFIEKDNGMSIMWEKFLVIQPHLYVLLKFKTIHERLKSDPSYHNLRLNLVQHHYYYLSLSSEMRNIEIIWFLERCNATVFETGLKGERFEEMAQAIWEHHLDIWQ